MSGPSKTLATYRRFPKELFRVNSGWRINLRQPVLPPEKTSFDVNAFEGGPQPVVTGQVNHWDNYGFGTTPGAIMRPNTPYMQHYVSYAFAGKNVVVYGVQEGTPLPDTLQLVHAGSKREEWSLQAAKEMSLEELNEQITNFFQEKAALLSKQQWMTAYPKPKEPQGPHHPLPKNWRARARVPIKF